MNVIRGNECPAKKKLPFTINITQKEEREKLDEIGAEIAAKVGLHYEGYSVYTAEPYSLEAGKPILYFD